MKILYFFYLKIFFYTESSNKSVELNNDFQVLDLVTRRWTCHVNVAHGFILTLERLRLELKANYVIERNDKIGGLWIRVEGPTKRLTFGGKQVLPSDIGLILLPTWMSSTAQIRGFLKIAYQGLRNLCLGSKKKVTECSLRWAWDHWFHAKQTRVMKQTFQRVGAN